MAERFFIRGAPSALSSYARGLCPQASKSSSGHRRAFGSSLGSQSEGNSCQEQRPTYRANRQTSMHVPLSRAPLAQVTSHFWDSPCTGPGCMSVFEGRGCSSSSTRRRINGFSNLPFPCSARSLPLRLHIRTSHLGHHPLASPRAARPRALDTGDHNGCRVIGGLHRAGDARRSVRPNRRARARRNRGHHQRCRGHGMGAGVWTATSGTCREIHLPVGCAWSGSVLRVDAVGNGPAPCTRADRPCTAHPVGMVPDVKPRQDRTRAKEHRQSSARRGRRTREISA